MPETPSTNRIDAYAPAEIAAMVRMLCGPGARFVTGQVIHVNGGWYM